MQQILFNNRYASLGDTFYVKTKPLPVASPSLIKFNDELARELGLSVSNLSSDDGAAIFSGKIS